MLASGLATGALASMSSDSMVERIMTMDFTEFDLVRAFAAG